MTAETIDEDFAKTKNYLKRLNELKNKKEENDLYLKFLNLTKEIFGNESDFSVLEVMGLLLKNQESAERLRKILQEKTEDLFKIVTRVDEQNNVIAIIIYPKERKEILKKYLKELNIPEMVTPSDMEKKSFTEKIKMLEEKLTFLSEQYQLLERELKDNIKEKKFLYLENLKRINKKLEEFKDRIYLYKSEKLFFIFGWVPKDKLDELRNDLKKNFDNVVLEEIEILENELEKIPVIIKNSAYFKPFEVLTKIFPLPSYSSYDPTIFLGIFFPIFFGIIVGDIGYGILILLISLLGQKFLYKNFSKNIAKILLYGGLSSIFFGLIYGEFFGEIGQEIEFIKTFKIVDRSHSILQMFFISIFIGISHIFVGFLLSLLRPPNKKERLVSLMMIFCLFLIIATLYFLFTGGREKLIYMILIFLGLVIVFSINFYGIVFPLELIKTIGNIVSYGRIMAIGLSSVILANVANNFLGAVGNIFVGVLIAVFIHIINIVLSVFSPTIHSLRLHYVEFFSKFMKFGGRKFNPL